MRAAHLLPCVVTSLAFTAVAANSLVGPGAVGSYQGPTHGRRHGGYVRVSEPSVGFFVAGSSIKAMNGLYARVSDTAGDAKLPKRTHQLVYRHDFTGWYMVLAGVGGPGRPGAQWLFVDNDGIDRFSGPGDHILPPAGDAFRHVRRSASGTAQATGSAVAASAIEDDPEELPWQIVGIGAKEMLERLRGYFRHYQHTVQASIDGVSLPKLPPAETPREQEATPPEDWNPPGLLAGEAGAELCLPHRKEEVRLALDESVKSDDRWAQVFIFVFIARCQRRQRNPEDAVRATAAALGVKPRSKDAIIEQGLARLDSEEYLGAIRSFEQLLRIDRNHNGTLDWLVRAHAHAQRQKVMRAKTGTQASLASQETAHCIAWRQTGLCDSNGPREPSADLPCPAGVASGASGYCECKAPAGSTQLAKAGETGCGHPVFTCAAACKSRWPLGGDEQQTTSPDSSQAPCDSSEPPDWCSANHYTVLGVPCDLFMDDGKDSEELKRAYKRRSLQLHPDKPGGHADAFQRVAAAHMVLSDAAGRKAYDDGEDLERSIQSDGTESPPHRQVIEKKYFPERFGFEPFGDPHADRKERQQRRQKQLERRRQEELAERVAHGGEL